MIVLIIEDAPEVMEIWMRFIAPVACEIRQAANLADAFVLMLKIPPPDLVLLDLRLPDSIKAEETLARVPELRAMNPQAVIVVITGAMDANLPILAREVGADGFLEKASVTGQEKLLTSIKESCSTRTTDEHVSMIARLSAFMANAAIAKPQTSP